MSNRLADTTLDTFANVYRLCRLNRGNLHFRGQFFRFAGGSIFIANSGHLVIRGSFDGALTPAFYADCLLRNGGKVAGLKDGRRHWIDRCRDTPPVRLP